MAYATVKSRETKSFLHLYGIHILLKLWRKSRVTTLFGILAKNMGTDLYIPICQMLHPGDKEDFSINPDTLKAVPVTSKEYKALQKPHLYGVSSLKTAEKALRSKRHGYMSDKKRGCSSYN